MPTTVLFYYAATFCALAAAALAAGSVGLVVLALFRRRRGRGCRGPLVDNRIRGRLLNGPCTWKLDTNANGNWEVETFEAGVRSLWFALAGLQAPYSLYYGMTDPDAPMALFFRRGARMPPAG